MYKIIKTSLGRDALRYIIKTYQIKLMHIPYYLCDVIRHTLIEEGCKPVFYHIDDNFFPTAEFSKNDYVLYPNYFGICQQNIIRLSQIYPKLIVDNAHAYYDTPEGFACFNAGHKFGKKESLLYIKTDEKDSYTPILPKNIPEIKEKFINFHSKYNSINLLNIDIPKIIAPFVYPCLCKTIEEADNLVKVLTSEGKTIYRYWNALPKSYNEYKFYSRLVPIPLNQNYPLRHQ